jgi:hypothetical protein
VHCWEKLLAAWEPASAMEAGQLLAAGTLFNHTREAGLEAPTAGAEAEEGRGARDAPLAGAAGLGGLRQGARGADVGRGRAGGGRVRRALRVREGREGCVGSRVAMGGGCAPQGTWGRPFWPQGGETLASASELPHHL